MKKIGLIVGLVSQGDQTLYTSESAKEWSRYIADPRTDAAKVENKDSDFVDFVRYGDDVALLYVHRTIPSRPGDCSYGAIIIPAGIDIKCDELENIVNEVKTELMKSTHPSESTKEAFNRLFDKEYNESSSRVICRNSRLNSTYAYQKYGNSITYTYGEILERNLFSPCYNSHKVVFLICDEDNIVPNSDVVELSQDTVDKHAILKYPVECPYKLSIDGAPFNQDRAVTIGSVVKIRADKGSDYVPQEMSVNIDAQYIEINSEVNNLKWNRYIKKSWFEVAESGKNEPIVNFTVKVNDIELLDYSPKAIPEADVQNANVVIESSGYESDRFILGTQIALLQSRGKIKRVLKKSAKRYEFIVRNKKGKDLSFHFDRNDWDETKSPLRGYKVAGTPVPKPGGQGVQITLVPKVGVNKILIAIIVGVSLLLAGASFWAGWMLSNNGAAPKSETAASSSKNNTTSNADQNVSTELKKLLRPDDKKWKRNEFKEAGQDELWEALSKFEFAQIIKHKGAFDKTIKDYLVYIEQDKCATTLFDAPLPDTGDVINGDKIDILKWTDLVLKAKNRRERIKACLDNSKWKKKDFEDYGYGELWDAVDNYDYKKIGEIAKKLANRGIGIRQGSKFQSWNEKVVNVCKEAKKKPSTSVASDGTLDLIKWNQAVVNENGQPAGNGETASDSSTPKGLKAILHHKKGQSVVWVKQSFKGKYDALWKALCTYKFDEIKKNLSDFDDTNKGFIEWAMEKSPSIKHNDKYSETTTVEITAYEWKEKIQKAIIPKLLKGDEWKKSDFVNAGLKDLWNAVDTKNYNEIIKQENTNKLLKALAQELKVVEKWKTVKQICEANKDNRSPQASTNSACIKINVWINSHRD